MQRKIREQREFVKDFQTAAAAAAAGKPSKIATNTAIVAYCDKNLTVAQAVALCDGDPQVFGSELTKHADVDKVTFDGNPFVTTETDVVTKIIAAKKNKNVLATAKSDAITAIQTEANKASKVTDDEIKTELNKATPKPIADNETWNNYINVAANTGEVTTRKDAVIKAITDVRKSREYDHTAD